MPRGHITHLSNIIYAQLTLLRQKKLSEISIHNRKHWLIFFTYFFILIKFNLKKYHIHSFFIFHDKIKGKTKAPYEKLSAAAGFPCRSLRKSHFWRRKEEMPVQEGHWRESQWRWRMVQWRWRCNNSNWCILARLRKSGQTCIVTTKGTIIATVKGRITNHFWNCQTSQRLANILATILLQYRGIVSSL